MPSRFGFASISFALLLTVTPSLATGQDQPMAAERAAATLVDSETAEFVEAAPGVTKAMLWGDSEAGPYGAFTRFEPGYVNEPHTHTNEVRIVVLEGAYVYAPIDGEEIRVEAGDYLSVPGGIAHVSGGDDEAGALFYESSLAGFDLVPAEE